MSLYETRGVQTSIGGQDVPSPAMAGTPSVKSQGMKFAEEHLQRHGWTEGKGLGKRESGISKAIKVKVKCDSAGVGHNSAEQFTFHWWDHVFNKTASSISVEPDQDGVQVKKVTDEDSVVTNKKPRKALTNRDMLYGRFIKSATLLSGGEQPVEKESSSDSSEDEDEKLNLSSATKLTDEDLVKICGGRTAHKGARHGLTMNAKLLRIEEQEQAFMEKYRKEKPNKEPAKLSLEKDVETARKKEKHRLGITNEDLSSNTTQRKKKKRKTVNGEETLEDSRTNGFEEHVPWKEEDTVASKRNVDNKGLVDAFNGVASSETKLENSKKKKKKVKDVDHARSIEYDVQSSKEANDLEDHGQPLEDDIQSSKKKKKKVKEADHLEDHACSIEYDVQSSKKGVKEANDLEDHGQPLEDDIQSSKKKKKKVQEAHHLENHARSIEDDVQSLKKKVKKEAHHLEDHAQPVDDDIQSSKKKKKKVQEAHHLEDHAQSIEDDVQSSKKKVQEAHDLEDHAQSIEDDVQSSKKKKKKVKEGADLLEDSGQPLEDGVQSSKKKKRKEEGKDETTEELTNGHQEWAPSEDLSLSKKKKARRDLKERVEESTEDCVQSLKKKKKQKKVEEVDEHMSIEDEVCQTPKKKKKSKNKYRDFSSPGEEPEQAVDDTEHTIRSKKKKRTE